MSTFKTTDQVILKFIKKYSKDEVVSKNKDYSFLKDLVNGIREEKISFYLNKLKINEKKMKDYNDEIRDKNKKNNKKQFDDFMDSVWDQYLSMKKNINKKI